MRHFVTPQCSLNNIPTLSYLNYLYVFVHLQIFHFRFVSVFICFVPSVNPKVRVNCLLTEISTIMGERFQEHTFCRIHVTVRRSSNKEYNPVYKQHILCWQQNSTEYICSVFAQRVSGLAGIWFIFLTFLHSQMKTLLPLPDLHICFLDKKAVARQHHNPPSQNGTQSKCVSDQEYSGALLYTVQYKSAAHPMDVIKCASSQKY